MHSETQHDPAHFDDEAVCDHAEALHTQAEPQWEGEPSHDQDNGKLPEVRVSTEERLFSLAVLLDLQSIVVEHDAGQAQAEAVPSKAQGVPGEHGRRPAKEDGHRNPVLLGLEEF